MYKAYLVKSGNIQKLVENKENAIMQKKEAEVFWNSKEFTIFIQSISDKAMSLAFKLMYHNGIAIEEVLLLRVEDFHLYSGWIRVDVSGKTDHQECSKWNDLKKYQVEIAEEQKTKIQDYIHSLANYAKDECVFQMSRQRLEREFHRGMETTGSRKMRLEDLYRCQKHSYMDLISGKVFLVQGYAENERKTNAKGDKEMDAREGQTVPIWKKLNLTLTEAADYSGIGINSLRKLCNEYENTLVLWVGTKRLIKRKKLDELTEQISAI